MFDKKYLAVLGLTFAGLASANVDVPVTGTVESKCLVTTDTIGIYGNATPSSLSTAQTDGGVSPVIRFDVLQASFYKARLTHPNQFSESPALNDTVTWTGEAIVAEVSDAEMSAYDTAKITFDNVTEVDLTVAGSTWFKVTSEAEYGVGKALPAGTYRTLVGAECIAL
jgi:hypothetical protein